MTTRGPERFEAAALGSTTEGAPPGRLALAEDRCSESTTPAGPGSRLAESGPGGCRARVARAVRAEGPRPLGDGERARLEDGGERRPSVCEDAALGKITSRVSPPTRPRCATHGTLLVDLRASPRDLTYQLRDAVRPHARRRVRRCGRSRIAPTVQIHGHDGGRVSVHGLLRCGSVWECPTCAAKITAARADEVRRAVEWHGGDGCVMLTLTVSHGLGDDLETLRRGIARSWQRLCSGKAWKTFRRHVGYVGSIRALEVTHGPHGYHPHLHVVLLVRDASELMSGCAPARADEKPIPWREWLTQRWQRAVLRHLGGNAVPSAERGAVLTPLHRADYLAKLGLELGHTLTKKGCSQSRSMWQVVREFALETGDYDDLLVWRRYVDAMKGARQLTWSRGLRAAASLGDERPDQDLAQETPGSVLLAEIEPYQWDDWQRWRVGDVELRIRRTAETGDRLKLLELLLALDHEANDNARANLLKRVANASPFDDAPPLPPPSPERLAEIRRSQQRGKAAAGEPAAFSRAWRAACDARLRNQSE
jgi:hypothetical protein